MPLKIHLQSRQSSIPDIQVFRSKLIKTPKQQMCLISAPSTGKINIISGDFGDSIFQHIGYPNFVTVENAVQMPLGRGNIGSFD